MPIYEYICKNCGRRNSFLVWSWEQETIKCSSCGSVALDKIISRFSRLKSEEERIEGTIEDAMRSVDINNPASIKGWMKRSLKEYASELGEDVDIDEAVESLGEELGLGKKEEGEGGEEAEVEEGSSEETIGKD